MERERARERERERDREVQKKGRRDQNEGWKLAKCHNQQCDTLIWLLLTVWRLCVFLVSYIGGWENIKATTGRDPSNTISRACHAKHGVGFEMQVVAKQYIDGGI